MMEPSSNTSFNKPGGYQNTTLASGAGPTVVSSEPLSARLDGLKKWTVSTYMYTRQLVGEKLGNRTRTVDEELQRHIDALTDMQKRYSCLLKLSKQMQDQLVAVSETQRQLAECMSDLSVKSLDLQLEFGHNSEVQRMLMKQEAVLLQSFEYFNSTVSTLCNKTIEDTISTAKDFQNARIEYDAYRYEVDTATASTGYSPKAEEMRSKYQEQKDRYEQLRNDLLVKIRFLEENKVQVMRQQLVQIQDAVVAFISGSKKDLDPIVSTFQDRIRRSAATRSSFLER